MFLVLPKARTHPWAGEADASPTVKCNALLSVDFKLSDGTF
jgi:hypothetical protein